MGKFVHTEVTYQVFHKADLQLLVSIKCYYLSLSVESSPSISTHKLYSSVCAHYTYVPPTKAGPRSEYVEVEYSLLYQAILFTCKKITSLVFYYFTQI